MDVHRFRRQLLTAALLLPATAALAPSAMAPSALAHSALALSGARPPVSVLLAPPGGQVVPDTTWDRLAQCESGGDWHADTGNGFYGGLQIWPPSWRDAGGLHLADRPDHATRRQQIAVAEEILRRQGWQAWSTCARRLGLH